MCPCLALDLSLEFSLLWKQGGHLLEFRHLPSPRLRNPGIATILNPDNSGQKLCDKPNWMTLVRGFITHVTTDPEYNPICLVLLFFCDKYCNSPEFKLLERVLWIILLLINVFVCKIPNVVINQWRIYIDVIKFWKILGPIFFIFMQLNSGKFDK